MQTPGYPFLALLDLSVILQIYLLDRLLPLLLDILPHLHDGQVRPVSFDLAVMHTLVHYSQDLIANLNVLSRLEHHLETLLLLLNESHPLALVCQLQGTILTKMAKGTVIVYFELTWLFFVIDAFD